jgi:2'-5' RNA ligase
MRLFVAITLPEEIREALGAAQRRLRAAQADVSWVQPDNIHITLKFLGEIDRKRVDRVRIGLAEATAVPPFRLTVRGLGTFGGRVPRVVWAGVAEGAAPLAGLARRVEDCLGRVGVPKEKRGFAGHLTLGRIRSPRNAEQLLGALAAEPAVPMGTVPVSEFALMQSELHPSGSVYTVLETYALRDPSVEGRARGGTDGA